MAEHNSYRTRQVDLQGSLIEPKNNSDNIHIEWSMIHLCYNRRLDVEKK